MDKVNVSMQVSYMLKCLHAMRSLHSPRSNRQQDPVAIIEDFIHITKEWRLGASSFALVSAMWVVPLPVCLPVELDPDYSSLYKCGK